MRMKTLLFGIKAKSAERDKLIKQLEISIDNEIQHDLDKNLGVSAYKVFDLSRYNSLVRAYKKAVKKDEETFEFEGRVLCVGYAKRMIDQLFSSFKGHPEARRIY